MGKNTYFTSISAGLVALNLSWCGDTWEVNVKIEQCSDIQRNTVNMILSYKENGITNLNCENLELKHWWLYDRKNKVYYTITWVKIWELFVEQKTWINYIYVPTNIPFRNSDGEIGQNILHNIITQEWLEVLWFRETLEREWYSYIAEVEVNSWDRVSKEIINKIKELFEWENISISNSTQVIGLDYNRKNIGSINNINPWDTFVVYKRWDELLLYFNG